MSNKITNYVLRHNKTKDEELRFDFMPSLLEIIERPAHKAGTIIILGVFTLLIAVVIWACLSKIDVVVTANGSVQPIGNLKVVQSYGNGIVEKINVSEGMQVSEGDTMIELAVDSVAIDEKQLNTQKAELEVQQKVYTKISNGEDLSSVNLEEYDENLRFMVQTILDLDLSARNIILNAEKEKSTAELNQQIAEVNLEEYEQEGTYQQIEAQKLLIQQYGLAIEQADIKLNDATAQYDAQVHTKLAEIDQQLKTINSELEKAGLAKEYLQLKAPVSGYINSVDVNTIGGTVSSGQQLITIVPKETPVEMVCRVRNMDIAAVKQDMEAAVKIEAYPYSKYGTVRGKVKYISPSAFFVENVGSVYQVKLELENTNENIELMSGLSGTVEIKTDKRSVMDYFLSPIINGLDESMKEK